VRRCFERGCWRKKRVACGGVCEQDVGERRGQIVTVFVNSVLETAEDSL